MSSGARSAAFVIGLSTNGEVDRAAIRTERSEFEHETPAALFEEHQPAGRARLGSRQHRPLRVRRGGFEHAPLVLVAEHGVVVGVHGRHERADAVDRRGAESPRAHRVPHDVWRGGVVLAHDPEVHHVRLGFPGAVRNRDLDFVERRPPGLRLVVLRRRRHHRRTVIVEVAVAIAIDEQPAQILRMIGVRGDEHGNPRSAGRADLHRAGLGWPRGSARQRRAGRDSRERDGRAIGAEVRRRPVSGSSVRELDVNDAVRLLGRAPTPPIRASRRQKQGVAYGECRAFASFTSPS